MKTPKSRLHLSKKKLICDASNSEMNASKHRLQNAIQIQYAASRRRQCDRSLFLIFWLITQARNGYGLPPSYYSTKCCQVFNVHVTAIEYSPLFVSTVHSQCLCWTTDKSFFIFSILRNVCLGRSWRQCYALFIRRMQWAFRIHDRITFSAVFTF